MKIVAANKKAEYDYYISQKIEAGIVLFGSEVKSLRINTGSIKGSHIIERDGNLWLLNCYIKKYNNSNNASFDPYREKKLLISKKEFSKVNGLIKQAGMTLVPISIYFNNKGLAKLYFGVGKGKKKYDKRQAIKEKDWNIKKERFLKKN